MSAIQRCNVLGVNVSAINQAVALATISQWIAAENTIMYALLASMG